ncbi:NrsF family protein [Bosea sp. RAF48]|uniref:NrsF family protein n=1 Tax=Bosea sp. RAF48 TaxID=3237480 RepID=UPI003F8E8848
MAAGWALLTLMQAPAEQWHALIFGRYWRACLIAVPLYALLPLILLLLLARRGAPVDRVLTGAFAGLASAGLATVAYGLHCPDDTAAFLAT